MNLVYAGTPDQSAGSDKMDLTEQISNDKLLTMTPVTLPAGNVWFDVEPNCTNANNPECNQDEPRYLESDTDGLNGINSKFTVTSKTGLGPVILGLFGEGYFLGLCNDEGVACGDGMSAGLLK